MIVTNSGKVLGGNRLVINDNINVFLGTQSTFWNNPNNWSLGVIPTQNQTAIIKANCTVNINFTVKNLIIESTYVMSFNLGTFTINYDLTCHGTLNQIGFASNIIIKDKFIMNGVFTPGTTSTITFGGTDRSQTIPSLPYNHVYVQSRSGYDIIQAGNLICNNYTIAGSPFTIRNYYMNGNLQVNGVFFVNSGFNFINTDPTFTFLVLGDFTVSSGGTLFNFPANYEIELRGGYGGSGSSQSGFITVNPLTIRYTTNNQNINVGTNNWTSNTNQNFNHLVDNIEVSVVSVNVNNVGYLLETTGWINGTTPTSKLINKAYINYKNSQMPMNIGILNCSSFINTFKYSITSSIDIAPIDYWNLQISSLTGTVANTKTFTKNTVIYGNLIAEDNFDLVYTSYTITVNGTTLFRSTP